MPNRIVRDGILTSERVDRLSWAEEVFYRRLQSVVDDHGRYYSNPKLIRAACFPLRLEKVSDSDVEKWLTACVEAALVRVYPASDGKRYLEVLDFGQRIQSKSKFPSAIGDSPFSTVVHGEERCSTVENGLVVVEDVVVVEGDTQRRRRPAKSTMPADFAVSDRVKDWAARKGHTRLDEHFENFCSKAKAKGYTYADWDEALMGAIRDDWANLRTPQTKGGESPAAMRPL